MVSARKGLHFGGWADVRHREWEKGVKEACLEVQVEGRLDMKSSIAVVPVAEVLGTSKVLSASSLHHPKERGTKVARRDVGTDRWFMRLR